MNKMEDVFAGAGKAVKCKKTHAMEVRKSAATLAWEIECA